MAQRIAHLQFCDWHGQLNEPIQLPAVLVRTNPLGRENDLCAFCGLLYDLAAHRMDLMLQFFHPEVIDRLFRVGRAPVDTQNDRPPAQLSLPGPQLAAPKRVKGKKTAAKETAPDPQPPAEQPKPAEEAHKRAVANRGRRNPDIDQVRCPLAHKGANSPEEYWVPIRDRGSHAKGSHGLMGPQIPYELPSDGSLKLDVKCFRHMVCAKAGGYGFKNAAGLAMHTTKADAEGWELAPAADTAATETATLAAV